jgi:hypothetical protein
MASVLIVVSLAPGEVLSRRNIGTAPRPDAIWFWRKYFPSGRHLLHLKQKKADSFQKLRVPSFTFVVRYSRLLYY